MSAWFLSLRGSRLAKTAKSVGLKVRDFVVYDRDLDLHQLKRQALCVSEALAERGWNEDIKQSGPQICALALALDGFSTVEH